MITEQDIFNDLTREFMPASTEEIEYLRAIASRTFKIFVNPLQQKLPKPPPLVTTEPDIKGYGASWNTNRKRLQQFQGDAKEMRKNGITSIINDNPNGWGA